MNNHRTSSIDAYPRFTTEQLRSSYLIDNLFETSKLQLTYTDLDRAIVGSAVPTNEALTLEAGDPSQ